MDNRSGHVFELAFVHATAMNAVFLSCVLGAICLRATSFANYGSECHKVVSAT